MMMHIVHPRRADPMDAPIQFLHDLVAIDSVNPDLVPGGAGEAAIAHYIAETLSRAGLEVRLQEVVPGRPNVIARARGTGGGPTLILNGHTDTVTVAGMTDPHIPRIEGNRLYGRGSFDMKAGVAACMDATIRAMQIPRRGDVLFTAVVDEEYASIGTEALLREYHGDAVIVTEPSDLDIGIAHKGFAWYAVDVHGVAAHGSQPTLGVDAIVKAGRFLTHIEALDLRIRQGNHPLLGGGSIHASLITGGQELSSYPAHCRIWLERRTIPQESHDVCTAQLQAIITELQQADATFKATLHVDLARAPFEISADAPLVHLVRGWAQHHTGRLPDLTGSFGWMESALFAQAGIPAVIFGPGGDGAHAIEEWADIAQTRQCADTLTSVIGAFCA
jgi:acetylornithine deacetylase